jgi:hypothetical protein
MEWIVLRGGLMVHRRSGRLVVALFVAAAVLFGSTLDADASGAYLSPGSTEVQATLTQLPTIQIALYGEAEALIQCTNFTFSFKTPKDGTTVKLTDPDISGCTTYRSGVVDTVTTGGIWKIGWKSSNSATLMNGENVITVSYGDQPGCVITIRPYAAVGEGRLSTGEFPNYTNLYLPSVKHPWPLTETGCLSQFTGAALEFKVALTPAVFYNS